MGEGRFEPSMSLLEMSRSANQLNYKTLRYLTLAYPNLKTSSTSSQTKRQSNLASFCLDIEDPITTKYSL